jgi:hypothetical protein
MIQSSLSYLVHSYPLASADNSTSYLCLKKTPNLAGLQGLQAAGRSSTQPRTGAPWRRAAEHPARATAATHGWTSSPAGSAAPPCRLSPPPPLSRSAARPAVVGRSWVEAQRPLTDDRLLLPRAPIAAPSLLHCQRAIARPLLPCADGLFVESKLQCRTGSAFAVDHVYNGAEAADNAWEHEPLRRQPRRLAEGRVFLQKYRLADGLQTPVVRALKTSTPSFLLNILFYSAPHFFNSDRL